ncbi:MAG: prenyltransferase [Flaviaesturariibacter sp.]|nr:prenyltransferase [Flaviaesturariibacter sp.]
MHPSTIQLLRLHFSLFLLPVYLFALSQLPQVEWGTAILVFFILHGLVYPASNGYNSYMDRDSSPIGGLEKPLQPTRQLFYVSVGMDAVAILASFFVSLPFVTGIIVYILASRAYSYRGIRLKRFPVAGFLTVFIFQGALIFFITYHGCHPQQSVDVPLLPMILSSLLIGALYPLTQVYQHEEDIADGVTTISYQLGKRGTFLFSMLQFVAATVLFFFMFRRQEALNLWWIYLVMLLPAVGFFLAWMAKVWREETAADFKHSFRMNLLATLCTTAYFITLNLIKH